MRSNHASHNVNAGYPAEGGIMAKKNGNGGRVFHNFKTYQERPLVRALDNRSRGGEPNEDDNWANNHLVQVGEDGARTWSC
jgi:hypothetical protein